MLDGNRDFRIFESRFYNDSLSDAQPLKKTISLWLVAFFVTVIVAYYQRVTGPSYPLTGKAHFKNHDIRYNLPRSHGGASSALIQVQTMDSTVRGFVDWKRFKTEDPWTRTTMSFSNGILTAELPNQPPAGKLQYRGDRHPW
jgi:hypothetical protein